MDQAVKDVLEELEKVIEQAKDQAIEAMRSAENAKGHAEDAMNAASEADDYAGYAVNEADNAQSFAGEAYELWEKLYELLDDGEVAPKDLARDIKKYKDKVREMRGQGMPPALIAEKLGISRFLVDSCLDLNTSTNQAA